MVQAVGLLGIRDIPVLPPFVIMSDKIRSCGSLAAGNEHLLAMKAEPTSPSHLQKLKEVGVIWVDRQS